MEKDKALTIYNNNTAIDIKKAAWNALSEESRKSYQSDYKLFFKFIQKDPKQVTANDILAYVEHLRAKGMKNNTINRKVASLSKMFKVAMMAGEIKSNPVATLKEFKNISMKTSKEVRISITINDVKKAVAPRKNDTVQIKKISLIIRTLVMTGLRISEFINIKNSDMKDHDKKNKIVRIVGKGRKERFIFLENSHIKEIKALYPDAKGMEYLFYSGKMLKYNRITLWEQISSFFKNRIDKSCHPHLLRHLYATYKINVEKQDIKAVSKFLGHSDVSITLNSYVDTALDVNSAKIKI